MALFKHRGRPRLEHRLHPTQSTFSQEARNNKTKRPTWEVDPDASIYTESLITGPTRTHRIRGTFNAGW